MKFDPLYCSAAKNGTEVMPDILSQNAGHAMDVENRFKIYLIGNAIGFVWIENQSDSNQIILEKLEIVQKKI